MKHSLLTYSVFRSWDTIKRPSHTVYSKKKKKKKKITDPLHQQKTVTWTGAGAGGDLVSVRKDKGRPVQLKCHKRRALICQMSVAFSQGQERRSAEHYNVLELDGISNIHMCRRYGVAMFFFFKSFSVLDSTYLFIYFLILIDSRFQIIMFQVSVFEWPLLSVTTSSSCNIYMMVLNTNLYILNKIIHI